MTGTEECGAGTQTRRIQRLARILICLGDTTVKAQRILEPCDWSVSEMS